jgi:tetratricopeptide (TPR) repeat protein
LCRPCVYSVADTLHEYSAIVRDVTYLSNEMLVEISVFVLIMIVSLLLKNKIKDAAISIDDKLYAISRNEGWVIRRLIYPVRFVLPSNPLRGYIDYRTATSLENDKIIDLSTISENKNIDDPTQYWRLGFTLPSIMSDLAVSRKTADGESVADDLIEELRSNIGRMIISRPGSGKSTICKQVACEWYQRDIGPVLYRESGHGSVTDEAALKKTIENTPPDQRLLVVIEDICDPEHIELIEPLVESRRGNVRYLFDARTTDIENLLDSQKFDTVRSKQTASTLLTKFGQYTVPSIDEEECRRIISKYEQVTGDEVVGSAESIYQRIENSTEVGQMLMLAYEISSENSELEDSELTGLEIDVSNKYGPVSNPVAQDNELGLGQYNPSLLYKLGFSINLYNVLDIPLSEELLVSIGEDGEERSEIRRILDSLNGWMIFESDSDGVFETFHELWSVYYLRKVLNDRSTAAQDMFITSINTFLQFLDRGDGSEDLVLTDSAFVYPVLLYIYQIGRDWPAISELFTRVDIAELKIPDEFRPEIDAELAVERSGALLNTGQYSEAEEELNTYHEIASKLDKVDQDDLERFYGHSLARIYIESGRHERAEEILNRLLADNGNNDVTEGYLLNLFGLVNTQLGNFQVAIEALEQAIKNAQENEDLGLEQSCVLNLGIALERGNNYAQAEEYYRKAVEIAEQTGNSLSIARSNHNLGQVIFTQSVSEDDDSRISEAINKVEYSYRVKKDLGDIVGQAKSLGALSNFQHRSGKYQEAEEYIQKSINIAEQYNNIELLAISYHNYALILRDQEEIDEAKEHVLKSIELHNITGNKIEEFRSLDILVSLNLIECDLEAAAEYAISGLKICLEAGDPATSLEVIEFLISLAKATNNVLQKMELLIEITKSWFYLEEIALQTKSR